MPGISRCPPALTPVAIRACTLTVRPPSHQDHRGGLPARTAPCPDHRSRSHGQAVPELLGPCARYTEAAHQIWSPNVISRPIATERVTSDRHTWVRRRTAGHVRICRIAGVAYPYTYALACIFLMVAAIVNSALSFVPGARRTDYERKTNGNRGGADIRRLSSSVSPAGGPHVRLIRCSERSMRPGLWACS
jgi:hypothetical protein